MRTNARQVAGGDWVLNGTKMWITNGGVADVAVVWARDVSGDDPKGPIRGFVVPTETPGFTANDIHKKVSLRASVTSELVMDDVRLPADAVLPGVASMRGPLSCLNEARYGILWGAAGAGRACYESALDYAKARVQFGQPIAGFQLTQRKLVEMMVKVNKASLLALHLGRMKDAGDITSALVSFGKLDNVREALWIAREARSVLGANGITTEYPVIRHMNNLESVYTYEGTTRSTRSCWARPSPASRPSADGGPRRNRSSAVGSSPAMDRDALQVMLDAAPYHQVVRMVVEEVDAEAGRFVLRLPFQPNLQRVPDAPQVHGGPIASVIDTAGTFAVVATVGHGVPTINLRIDYLRPAIDTDLVATATVRRVGRTVAVCDVDLTDDQGRLVAVGRGTWGTAAG